MQCHQTFCFAPLAHTTALPLSLPPLCQILLPLPPLTPCSSCCFLPTLVAKKILEALCILEAAVLLSSTSLSSRYLYREAGMKILIFPKSVAALPPSLQLFTPPFPLHHVQASRLPFLALLPLCCSFSSTFLIVPPTLSCHIVPYSSDLTIERKKEGIQWRGK